MNKSNKDTFIRIGVLLLIFIVLSIMNQKLNEAIDASTAEYQAEMEAYEAENEAASE